MTSTTPIWLPDYVIPEVEFNMSKAGVVLQPSEGPPLLASLHTLHAAVTPDLTASLRDQAIWAESVEKAQPVEDTATALADEEPSVNLAAYVTQSLHSGGIPELISPCSPLPIINITCLGLAARLPYSVSGLAEEGQKVAAQQKAELTVMVPAFSGLLRGQQSQESLAEEVDNSASQQSFWSPYNEACVYRIIADASVSLRPTRSCVTLLQAVNKSAAWQRPDEVARKGQAMPPANDSSQDFLIPILLARHAQLQMAVSKRSIPAVRGTVRSYTGSWGHVSCESLMIWLSPYHVNELLHVAESFSKRLARLKRRVQSLKDPEHTGEQRHSQAAEAPVQPTQPTPPAPAEEDNNPADLKEKQAPMVDQEHHASPGCSFSISMVSILLSSMTEQDQDGVTGSRLPRGVLALVEGNKSLVYHRGACTSSGLELVVNNLHGVARMSRTGGTQLRYNSKVDGVMLRNLRHGMDDPSAFLLRPNQFHAQRMVDSTDKIRQRALMPQPPMPVKRHRLLSMAWQQHHLLQAACEGYCMPINLWLKHVENLAKNLKQDATMIRVDVHFTQARSGIPSLDLNMYMDGTRMFVTVATLKAVVDTAAQSTALQRMKAKGAPAKPASAAPSDTSKQQEAQPPGKDDSSTIKALTGIRVNVHGEIIGGTMELVASDNTRVVKGIVRKSTLRIRLPGDGSQSKKSTDTLSAAGGLLHARFSIDDMLIKDLVARDSHSMVLRSSRRGSNCRLDFQFGIHRRSRKILGHVAEASVQNPQMVVMMQLIKNILYCIQDALQGLKPIEGEAPAQTPARTAPPPKSDNAPKRDAMTFAVRLRISQARVLLPVSSHSKRTLGLDLQNLMLGFPGNALTTQELPPHCASAATLLRDCDAVSCCNLRGAAGQLKRRDAPDRFETDAGINIANLRVYSALMVPPQRTAPQEKSTLDARLRNMELPDGSQIGIVAHAVVSLKGRDGSGLHLHTNLPSLHIGLGNQQYRDFMGFLAGNLADHDVFTTPPPPPQPKQNTAFSQRPPLRPPPKAVASMRISMFVSRIQIVLSAPASCWTKPPERPGTSSPRSHDTGPRLDPPVAFLRLTMDNLILNLGMLQAGRLHLDIASGCLDADDLRFATQGKAGRLARQVSMGMRAPPVSRHQAACHTPVMHMRPVLVNSQPVFETAEVPVVAILTAPVDIPEGESAHIEPPQAPPLNVMSIRFAIVGDGTMGAEVSTRDMLAQWPYLADLSLIMSITSILDTGGGQGEAQATALPQARPWFYFNFLYSQSQAFIPIVSPALGSTSGYSQRSDGVTYNNAATALVARCCAKANRSGWKNYMKYIEGKQDQYSLPDLTATGICATMSALRFGYFMGGDGETRMLVGMDNNAVSVRHPHACMSVVALPFSMTAQLSMQRAEAEMNRNIQAARKIQRWFRYRLRVRRWRARYQEHQEGAKSLLDSMDDTEDYNSDSASPPANPSRFAHQFMAQLASPVLDDEEMPSSMATVDGLVSTLSDDRFRRALESVKAKEMQTVSYGPGGETASRMANVPMTTSLELNCSAITVRAAFSHVFLFRELATLFAGPPSDMESQPSVAAHPEDHPEESSEIEHSTSEMEPIPTEGEISQFRPTVTQLKASVDTFCIVLCNDRPHSYGAPDFFMFTSNHVSAVVYSEKNLPNQPADVVAQMSVVTMAEYLDNSSGVWSRLLSPWPLDLNARLTGNQTRVSSYTTEVSLQSRERLETTFSPSLLLSLGDILSFLSDAGSISPSGEPISLQHWYGRSTDQAPQPAPTIEEQMALQRPLTSRIPQKYLIRNFTGLALRYWSGDSERVTSYSLPHLGEETLAIEPSSSTMSVLMGKERNLMRYPARVVHLRFEGNWMPVRNIAVNHISTTCYRVVSPLEGVSVPLIVDISLDGRTKTVVLRSAVTLRNCCDQLLSFRLHIPNLNVVGPSWIGESIRTPSTPAHEEQPISSSRNDIDLGWFADGEAFHLPIYAVLGGTLYMKSKDVHEAAGDAVHLMPSIQDMRAQQGYVRSHYPNRSQTYSCAVLVKPLSHMLQNNVKTSGIIEQSTAPIDCEIQYKPTLQLYNGLPYPLIMTIKEVDPRKARPAVRVSDATRGELTAQTPFSNQDVARTGPVASRSIKGAYHAELQVQKRLVQQVLMPPGTGADIYADLSMDIMALAEVPALRLDSERWTMLHKSRGARSREKSTEADEKQSAKEAHELKLVKQRPQGTAATASKSSGGCCSCCSCWKTCCCCCCGSADKATAGEVAENEISSAAEQLRVLSSYALNREDAWLQQQGVQEIDVSMHSGSMAADAGSWSPSVRVELAVQADEQVHVQLLPAPPATPAPPPCQPVRLPRTRDDLPVKVTLAVGDDGHVGVAVGVPTGMGLTPVASEAVDGSLRRHISLGDGMGGALGDRTDSSPQQAAPVHQEDVPRASGEPEIRAAQDAPGAPAASSQRSVQFPSRMQSSRKRPSGGSSTKDLSQLRMAGSEAAVQPEERLTERFEDTILCAPEVRFLLNRDDDDADQTMRVVTVAAPFWVNNCTGHHLVFMDEMPPSLVKRSSGARTRRSEILVPFQTSNIMLGTSSPGGFLPSLLNQQSHSKIRFAKSALLTGGSTFSSRFRISTIAQPRPLDLIGLKKIPDHEAPAGFLIFYNPSNAPGSAQQGTRFWMAKPDLEPETTEDKDKRLSKTMTIRTAVASDATRATPLEPRGFSSLPAAATRRSSASQAPMLHRIDSAPAAMEKREVTPADAKAIKRLQAPPEHKLLVEVKPGPTDTPFRHSKIVEVRNKYIVENLTGMDIEMKQVGQPDAEALLGVLSGDQLERLRRRRLIPNGGAQPLVMVQNDCGQEVVFRPADGNWCWSGRYKPQEKEEYFGMRLLHRHTEDSFLIMPVSVNVGRGTVLISLQSTGSVPPYRLQNLCSSLQVTFCQAGLPSMQRRSEAHVPDSGMSISRRDSNAVTNYRPAHADELAPGTSMDYAFDEPTLPHKLLLTAPGTGGERETSVTVDLDNLGGQQVWVLPSVAVDTSQLQRRKGMSDGEHKRRTELAKLARRHWNRKVYLEVYANGPTRTLRISEVQGGADVQRQLSTFTSLATRNRELEARLRMVNRSYMVMMGLESKPEALDLFGCDTFGYAGAEAQGEVPAHSGGSAHVPGLNGPQSSSSNSSPTAKAAEEAPDRVSPPRPMRGAPGPSPLSYSAPAVSPIRSSGPGTSAMRRGSSAPTAPKAASGPEIEPLSPDGESDQGVVRMLEGIPDSDEHDSLSLDGDDHEGAPQALLQLLQVLQGPHRPDLELMLGGELSVTVLEATSLSGDPRMTNPFAVLRAGSEALQSSVLFETVNPEWNHQSTFRQVLSLNDDLQLELWDLAGGVRKHDRTKWIKELNKQGQASLRTMVNHSRFLGSVSISLRSTLTEPTQSFALTRRKASDAISGEIRLRFSWDITALGLLTLKQRVLERVIKQRAEIISLLNPIPSSALTEVPSKPEAAAAGSGNGEGEQGDAAEEAAKEEEDKKYSDILKESKKSLLEVTVLGAKGVTKSRLGLGQGTAAPMSWVEVSILGPRPETQRTEHAQANPEPVWSSGNHFQFSQLSPRASLQIKLVCKYGWASRASPIGEVIIPMAQLMKLDNPSHVWLELPSSTDKGRDEQAEGAQVFLRIAHSTNLLPSQHINQRLKVDLKGVGIAFMQSQGSELLNITYNTIQADVKISETETQIGAVVHVLQIDNQLMTATKPVMLAPNARSTAGLERQDDGTMAVTPMIVFQATRSFQTGNVHDDTKKERIMSFKEIKLSVSEMDFQADEDLLEALLVFAMSIPTQDLSQNQAAEPAKEEHEDTAAGDDPQTLLGVSQEYMVELDGLRGSSSSGSWFFIENLQISDIAVNVSMSVTSRLVQSTSGLINFGQFGKYLGAAGFSLVNASNVPLKLGGLQINSELLSMKNLVGRSMRHYISQGLREAHKVMGGSGPGIAGLPLTAVWAAGSTVDIAQEVFKGDIGFLGALQKGGYVVFTASGQIVGAVGKTVGSLLLWTPPYREDRFSDTTSMARFIARPGHAPEALYRSVAEPLKGCFNAVIGLYLDPVAGALEYGPAGLLLGTGKGLLGLLLRPMTGVLEGGSKFGEGIGLLCLGAAGIEGRMTSRVRAPGTLQPGLIAEQTYQAMKERGEKLAKWRGALEYLVPKSVKDDETITDVVVVTANRIIMLTSHRILWLSFNMKQNLLNKSLTHLRWTKKHLFTGTDNDDDVGIEYQLHKVVKLKHMQTVTGRADRLSITVHYVLSIPRTRISVPTSTTFVCNTRDTYNRVIYLIHQQGKEQSANLGPKQRRQQYDIDTTQWSLYGGAAPAELGKPAP
eukprot:jgi/Tetstr1/453080/TSEL_040115.t1